MLITSQLNPIIKRGIQLWITGLAILTKNMSKFPMEHQFFSYMVIIKSINNSIKIITLPFVLMHPITMPTYTAPRVSSIGKMCAHSLGLGRGHGFEP